MMTKPPSSIGGIRRSISASIAAGADFVVAACNSVHVIYDEICDDLPIPWTSIMDATTEQLAQERINEIIYGELVKAGVTDPSRQYVLGVIDKLAGQGAQGVVLGCTELPFLIQQPHTQVLVYDTTAIHAQKALDLALA